MNYKLKLNLFLITISLCIMPFLLNLFGVDFSSQIVTLSVNESLVSTSNDEQFYALSGAFHHALLEWSAVILALIAGVSAFFHYYRYKDISVAIIGLALLCAGFTDAFHTLAATRVISANAPNSDFIPFTWAFSRIFNAIIMIIGVIISLWFTRSLSSKKITLPPKRRSYQNKILLIVSISFITFAISSVIIAATSSKLPQTTFTNALITRPYDALPLALFAFAGVLIWLWDQRNTNLLKFTLLLSIIPQITTQLHMCFGSSMLFDNHFNIAHALKIVAYAILTFGFIGYFLNKSQLKNAEEPLSLPQHSQQENLPEQKGLLDIGVAKYPLSLILSCFTFTLAIVITLMVSSIYSSDAERLTKEHRLTELAGHGDVIEVLIRKIYEDSTDTKQDFQDELISNMNKLNFLSFRQQQFYLADKSGEIIYHKEEQSPSDQKQIYQPKLQQVFPSLATEIANNISSSKLSKYSKEKAKTKQLPQTIGHYRAVSLSFNNSNRIIHLFIKMDERILLAQLSTFKVRSLVIGIGLTIIAIAFALLLSRKLSQPLQLITQALARYSHTGEIKELPIHAQDESGVLARGFRNLLMSKAAQDKALKQQKGALDEHAIVSITDIRGNIKYTNEKFTEISGYSKQELFGKNHRILNSGNHSKEFFKNLYRTISQGKTWQGEICNKAKSGRLYWVNTTIVPFLSQSGKPESYVSIRTDISKDKLNSQNLHDAKEDLSQQITKLKQANAELDQFAYVASHDLKSPLNGISQLVSWLEEDCADILPEDSKEHLVLLKSRSKRMITLLNDLLEYSRIGRKDYPAEHFNLAQLVHDVFDLQGNREGFTCNAENKELFLQKIPFELVLRNLISNALKHHHKTTGIISIYLTVSEHYYHLNIADDGPGIPPKLHNKALEMFQTLQSRDKTEGSGMGLALVRKTVLYHGGTLTINSDGTQGTIIEFSWPLITEVKTKEKELSFDIEAS